MSAVSVKKKVSSLGSSHAAGSHPVAAPRASTNKKTTSRPTIDPTSPRARAHAVQEATTVAAHAMASSGSSVSIAGGGSSQSQLSPSSLYWSNLSLLGFDPQAQAAKHKIEMAANMFDRPNAKAMQVVMHFLLLKCKSGAQLADQHNQAPEWKDLTNVFHHSYPCVDRNQARDFLACVVGVLLGFEKGSANVFPTGTIRKSHFAAPQGERLYTIFWHLSTYTMQVALATQFPGYSVPTLQLPALTDHALFPHLIKVFKAHISRQSATYITRLHAMEAAEDGWRETADGLTRQYQSLQQQMAELHTAAPPRIPGQPNVEVESDRVLFSAHASAEVSNSDPARLAKLQNVKDSQVKLHQLFSRTEQQRNTLNDVLNGAWQPTILDRAQLDRLMASPNDPRGVGQSTLPLNFTTIVAEWNDSLLKMQGVLAQYMQPGATVSPYVSGLTEASASMEVHVKEHHVKLANLRALSHNLRTNLVPELETELSNLQRQLRERGAYSGPIYQSAPPALIPPTPARLNHAPNLAVPRTPAFVPSNRSAPIQTPNHAPQRLPSRISDSVRRAAHSKTARQAHQRDYLLTTIVDEEQQHVSPAAHAYERQVAAAYSQQRYQPSLDDEKYTIVDSPLLSPQSQHGSDGTSPQFPKKLVFSPDDLSRSRLSVSSQQPQPHSTRSSLSPAGYAAASRFTSPPAYSQATPPAHTSSHTPVQSHRSASRFLSPTTNLGDEGLLGADELYYQEEEEDDDEVVFGGAVDRRVSSTSVDPDAPTPAPARRTEARFGNHSTPPAAAFSTQAASRLLASPSYDFGGDGLL